MCIRDSVEHVHQLCLNFNITCRIPTPQPLSSLGRRCSYQLESDRDCEPVGIFGLCMPLGRSRTVPSAQIMLSTGSCARTSRAEVANRVADAPSRVAVASAGSSSCVVPNRSRSGTNITPPITRGRCTDPSTKLRDQLQRKTVQFAMLSVCIGGTDT